MRLRPFVLLPCAALACSPGTIARGADARADARADVAAADAVPPPDAPARLDVVAADSPTPDAAPPPPDAALDGSVRPDAATMDAPVVVPGCDPVPGAVARGYWTPATPVAPSRAVFHLEGPDGWTNLDVQVRNASGATLAPAWVGVTGGPGSFHWQWAVDPTAPGDWCVTVRTDPGATVRFRGAVRIAGSAPADAGPGPDVVTPPGAFVTRSGSEFFAGGTRLRFVGMNSRGLPHYGAAPLPFARADQIETELDEMRRMGARVVRVFAADENVDHATAAARLQRVLDGCAARGMWALVVLTDFYASTPFHPRGDRAYYARSADGFDILSNAFFTGGFRANYLPWVRAVVARYASHPAVFSWQLGNEIKNDPDHGAFIRFVGETAAVVRALAPRHLVSIGMITSRWMNDAEARDVHRIAEVDFVTLHAYPNTRTFTDFEYAVARDVGKPLVVQEVGFRREDGDRPSLVDADLRDLIDRRGGRGYMQWGFTVITPDNGNGDREFGMDRLGFAFDYDRLFATYQAAAARIR